MGHVTSRVFAAIERINADLTAATWPLHDPTAEAPTIGVGDSENPKALETEVGEFVDVLYRVEDDAAIDWTRIVGRDESFLIDVFIRSSIPGADRPTAWGRLQQLAEVVQTLYLSWDATARRVVFTPPAFDGVAPLGGLSRVTPQMWRTGDGWAGDCVVTFRINARLDKA